MMGGLKRVGAVRARVVGCPTEPGIVCFPAVSQSGSGVLTKPQGREALRGPRRSSGSPGPDRADSRSRRESGTHFVDVAGDRPESVLARREPILKGEV